VTVVIDTSALMAFVKREPGADRVGDRLSEGIVSPVIFAETLSKLALQNFDERSARIDLLAAGLSVESFGPDDVQGVVILNSLALRGISLANRFCLALALDRNLPVLTGDRAWANLGLPLQIELIR
jgi:PIN domain nuclease of toxin-antitoxin system